MCDLSGRGWQIVMLAHGVLASALMRIDTADQMVRNMSDNAGMLQGAEQSLQRVRNTEVSTLDSANQSLARVVFDHVLGRGAAHQFHATFVSRIAMEGTDVRVNCANWGGAQRWVTVPASSFANKLCGFVAVSN